MRGNYVWVFVCVCVRACVWLCVTWDEYRDAGMKLEKETERERAEKEPPWQRETEGEGSSSPVVAWSSFYAWINATLIKPTERSEGDGLARAGKQPHLTWTLVIKPPGEAGLFTLEGDGGGRPERSGFDPPYLLLNNSQRKSLSCFEQKSLLRTWPYFICISQFYIYFVMDVGVNSTNNIFFLRETKLPLKYWMLKENFRTFQPGPKLQKILGLRD